MTDIVIPTHDEICATFERVRHKVGAMHLCLDATIDDYPIGRRERGKCRLQVERTKGKGYRTVRTTTDKNGRWCKPKKSTYSNNVIVVASNVDEEHHHAWLEVGIPTAQFGGTGVWLTYANGDTLSLAKCWRSDPPRREDYHYSSQTSKPMSIFDVGNKPLEYEEPEQHVEKAAPPEEIALWDAWAAGLIEIRRTVYAIWHAAALQS